MKKLVGRAVVVGVLGSVGVVGACVVPGVAQAGEGVFIRDGIGLGSAEPVDHFSRASVELGVAKVLKDSYGIEDVGNVQCPERMEVTVGAVYVCTLEVEGAGKNVTIRVTKSDGTYEVGRPE